MNASPASGLQRGVAVVIGIDRYQKYNQLFGCVNDAKEVAECLALEGYNYDVRLLVDGQATRSAILRAIGEAIDRGDDEQTLILYFAGHGEVVGNSGYLVSTDASEYDLGVSLAHLAQLMESAAESFKNVVTILDCCHSGAAYGWVNNRPLTNTDVDQQLPAINGSRCILAACQAHQLAGDDSPDDKGIRHGAFTRPLITGLLGDAVDHHGRVTVFGLHDYLESSLHAWEQMPVFRGDVAGTVVLGDGFSPRVGTRIPDEQKSAVLAKGQQLVDTYKQLQNRLMSAQATRRGGGSAECARTLEPTLAWFADKQQSLPALANDPIWRDLRDETVDFQRRLSEVGENEVLQHGTAVEKIGTGGYGTVWRVVAEDGVSAIKIFHGNELGEEVKAQRFKSGFKNMRLLKHPRIVQVKQIFEAPLAFSMEYINGGDLRSYYVERDAPEKILRLLIDIAQTVTHAHSQGVLHRDIKPENIIVTLDGDGQPVPYLTDFDLAYHDSNRTVTSNLGVGGVINYAAPEQLFEPNAKTAREKTVDVYAFGQLLYFVVMGQNPAGDDIAGNEKRLEETVKNWVDDAAARALLDVYQHATKRNPADRQQDFGEILESLTQALIDVEQASGKHEVEERSFCQRVAHTYAGLNGYTSSEDRAAFRTLSGGVQVTIRLRGVPRRNHTNLEIELAVTNGLQVPSKSSAGAARNAVNARLDKALKRFPNTKRHPGNHGHYQVFVECQDIPLDVNGIADAHRILLTAISAIESWS